MKTIPVLAVLLAGGLAHAQAPTAKAPESAPETMRIELRDSVAVSFPDATAAFSVDSTVAEASAAAGRITVVGRSVGATTISVVTPTSVKSFALIVTPPPHSYTGPILGVSASKWTVWQGNYESSSARLTNSLELVDRGDLRTLRGYAVNVTRLDTQASDVDSRTSLPALALEWRARRNELVLFDKTVDHSPLTLDNTTVRGVHVRVNGAELHAGITSPLLYQGFFLQTQRAVVLGASYELRTGRSTFTPNVYGYPSTPEGGGTEGAMGSVLYRYATRDDRLLLRGELGWGGALGAALELGYHADHQRGSLSARHQPRDFAGVTVGRPNGSTADALWTFEPNQRLIINAAGNAARYEIGDLRQDIAAATTDARVVLVPHLSASSGVSVGRFSGSVTPEPVKSIAVPVGLHVDVPGVGASAVYRYQANTARNDGGHGGRLSVRGHRGALHGSAFADMQQDAATLELILKEEPALAQLLNEMGLTASTPDELARLLRENATLAQLGLVEGANLELNPLRTQAGADLAWLAQDNTRQQLRLRLLFDRTETVSHERDTRSVSLAYSRRLGSALDMTSMLSWWSRGDGMAQSDAWSIAAGLRVRIDDVPRIPTWRRSDIDGVVVNEGRAGVPMPGVKVRLDGGRTAVSDANGRFVFPDVIDGEHRVEAELPPETYFTSPSRVAVSAGGSVRFGLAEAPARLSGSVVDDLGRGIGGMLLVLRGPTGTFTVTTDSAGRFGFAVADGDYDLELVRESIPAGYDTNAVTRQPFHLDGIEPTRAELVVPANRSIAGTIQLASGAGASVTLVELGRSGAIDDTGRYVFRGLKPGTYTVEATVGDKTFRRTVEVPAGPGAIRDIDFP